MNKTVKRTLNNTVKSTLKIILGCLLALATLIVCGMLETGRIEQLGL